MPFPSQTTPPTIATLHDPNWELRCQDVSHKQRLFALAERVGVPVDTACRHDPHLIISMRYRDRVMTLCSDKEAEVLPMHQLTDGEFERMAAIYPRCY
jgi:hypothetical protein